MLRVLAIIFTGIVVSFYYFPFEFSFLPGLNTKMGLAVVGVVLVVLQSVSKREVRAPKNLLIPIIWAVLVSLIGVLSNILNNTPDYVYATYVVSMIVWLSAALVPVVLIKRVHNKVDPFILAQYIAAVCVIQCFLAQIIDSNAEVKHFVDRYILQGQDFLNDVNRIYGIGANLDVAGSRFAAALIMLTYTSCAKQEIGRGALTITIMEFIIITVLGSMIARTTYVGVVISLLYLLLKGNVFAVTLSRDSLKRIASICLAILVALIYFINLYHSNEDMQKMFRFAFEGFFNLVETGEWSIASNERLKTMYVLPDNIHTWIIGDGYFNNPTNVDPYYVGEITGGYYKGTDVGYLRFIFYFGILGLMAFSVYFLKVAHSCIQYFPNYKKLFILILLANYTIWFKVSTDVFLVFALFLCIGNMQDEIPELEEEG